MKKIFNCYFLLFEISIIVLGASCKYEPTEVNYHDIEQNVDLFTITLNPEDTNVFIFNETFLKMGISDTTRKVDSAYISFNGIPVTIYRGYYWVGSSINPNNYKEGIYELVIVMFTKTGSGSLLEKIGMEKKRFEYKWNVTIKKVENLKPEIVMMDEINGVGKLIWREFDFPGFYGYLVTKSYNYPYTPYYSDTIRNIQDTFLLDNNIIRGKVDYTVSALVKQADGRIYKFTSNKYLVNLSGTITSQQSKDYFYTVNWEKPVFWSNISKIEIIDTNNKINKVLFSTSDYNILTAKIDYNILYKRNLLWRITPKDTIFGQKHYSELFTLKCTDTMAVYYINKILHGYNGDDLVYTQYSLSTINVINIKTRLIQSQFYIKNNAKDYVALSENNKYFVTASKSLGSDIYYKLLPDYYTDYTIKTSQLIGQTSIKDLIVTNDGIVYILTNNLEYENSTITVFNITTNSMISKDTVILCSSIKVSHDGSRIVAISEYNEKANIYEFVNNKMKLLSTINGTFDKRSIKFFPNSVAAAFVTDDKLQIRDCADGKLVQSFSTPGYIIQDIDYTNNYILITDDTFLYVYDTNSGALKKRYSYFAGDLAFMNSTILSSGIFAKITY
jgi:hypothetical protein